MHSHSHDNQGHDHSHHHHHNHHHHHDLSKEGNKKGLKIALAITLGIMLLEFVGGLVTNSLALLSDSGHMLSDAAALVLSLVAFWFASKPASPRRTFGYYRFEILAALFNGIALFFIAGFIILEAYERFFEPPVVAGGSMMLIALIGLAANLASAWFLMLKGDVKNNVNMKSAYIHVLGDALGSVGAIAAGLCMYFFDWYAADPIISVLVALLILKSAWGIITNTVHILMEGTPGSIDQTKVKRALEGIEGVKNVHDLHIWTITSGLDSMSCHVLVEDGYDCQEVLQKALQLMKHDYHIDHCTIQVENSTIRHEQTKI
ncbi:cation diffusion facilitator family transporter [Paenibacillus beijingensis]|uniref:Zinc transporter ZitB n=1 Tax=Paenibacillus beijingensis TaxID=1126833 RepID=A0A0D5NLH8_9BACL|nr:cation diffusion facilitator family transporter [Paenibacillus beijingensis]AJY76106.1 zinc transporter ZitB [Paenibacillus beijingensis]